MPGDGINESIAEPRGDYELIAGSGRVGGEKSAQGPLVSKQFQTAPHDALFEIP